MRILHVVDSLDSGDCARQIGLLAPTMAATGDIVEVCCVGSADRQVDELRRRGVEVHVLGWTRWLDAAALWQLRRLLRGSAWDIFHVWRLPALRLVALVARELLPRVVVSSPLPRGADVSWWDRRLLGSVRCVVLTGESDRQGWAAQRHPLATRWQIVPSAAPDACPATAPAWMARYPRRIVCSGRLERGSGLREAVWAVDILGQLFPDVHLLIGGSGPRRAVLAEMIERLGIGNAHLLGDETTPAELIAGADVCWVPSRDDVGRQEALEAMALGHAVVASDVPCVRDLIRDGETGYLVPPGDPVALARRTRALLVDSAMREQIGQAGRAEVLRHCGLPHVASRWRHLYHNLAAKPAGECSRPRGDPAGSKTRLRA